MCACGAWIAAGCSCRIYRVKLSNYKLLSIAPPQCCKRENSIEKSHFLLTPLSKTVYFELPLEMSLPCVLITIFANFEWTFLKQILISFQFSWWHKGDRKDKFKTHFEEIFQTMVVRPFNLVSTDHDNVTKKPRKNNRTLFQKWGRFLRNLDLDD